VIRPQVYYTSVMTEINEPLENAMPSKVGVEWRPARGGRGGEGKKAALRMSMEQTAPYVGARVKLHSLEQKPEHKDFEGEVLEFDGSVGRWKVRLHPARTHTYTHIETNTRKCLTVALPHANLNPHPFPLLLPDQGVEGRAQGRVQGRCSF
jgi:hypothetical protein